MTHRSQFLLAARLVAAFAASLGLPGCGIPAHDPGAVGAEAPADPRFFDPETLDVGDRFLGLRVTMVDAAVAVDSTWVGDVEFAGTIRLAGTAAWHPDHPEVDLLCFDVDSASVGSLPRWPLDRRRRVWFCFSNRDEAVRRLGEPGAERRVTIEIDDYRTVRHYTDAFDTARLVRVID